MSLEPYNPLDSIEFYRDYYKNQSGAGVQVYAGRRTMPSQGGEGIGALFSGLLRAAAPIVKTGLRRAAPVLGRVAKNAGKHALKAGADVAGDLIAGRNFKTAARERLINSGVNILDDAVEGRLTRPRKRAHRSGGRSGRRQKRAKTIF